MAWRPSCKGQGRYVVRRVGWLHPRGGGTSTVAGEATLAAGEALCLPPQPHSKVHSLLTSVSGMSSVTGRGEGTRGDATTLEGL